MKRLDCGHAPTETPGVGSGYGTTPDGRHICYACCAKQDRETMRETGRITLYLTEKRKTYELTNWPGTLRISPLFAFRKSTGRGFGGSYPILTGRFLLDGDVWTFRHAGRNSQLAHCRRIKEST